MVTISLFITGTDEEPRWTAELRHGRQGGNYCCGAGHFTPEAAASHGGERASALLARAARMQSIPVTAGGMAIEKLEAVA